MLKFNVLLQTLILLLSMHVLNAQSGKYDLLKKISVGDQGGWDYLSVDEVNRNLYVSHGIKVLVISLDRDSVVGEIPNTQGVHGIAIDNELNKGFISDGRTNSVTAFDLKSFKTIDTLAISGLNPDAILYEPFSKKVYTFNGKSHNASVIDATSFKMENTIDLPGKPEFAVTDLKGKLYVNIEDKSEIVQIDAIKQKIMNTWSISPGEEPSGLAIDKANNLLFSVCNNKKLIVFDVIKGKNVSTIPIGGGVDAVSFDPQTKLIYTSNGEGNVTIIKQFNFSTYSVIQTLSTQAGSRTMTLDPKSKKIYLSAAKFEPGTRKMIPGSFEILVYQ